MDGHTDRYSSPARLHSVSIKPHKSHRRKIRDSEKEWLGGAARQSRGGCDTTCPSALRACMKGENGSAKIGEDQSCLKTLAFQSSLRSVKQTHRSPVEQARRQKRQTWQSQIRSPYSEFQSSHLRGGLIRSIEVLRDSSYTSHCMMKTSLHEVFTDCHACGLANAMVVHELED